ncbi:N,N'-diacetylchitobiose transport system substrate-binding protein [Streptosporangium becharense]|uniref:N,N'-diacetylchitobiose transport system substrate-binding protein n=1 Tax=Streptosporangium becharense TaxID=1816182 RepID=A0A7W9IDP3_9ACTN|nr:extracellular solute-binding protein [Streptosporangium becharense]MBB2912230.1 N,N'-diacetylchitobiose transport system substrate-binding protein [Streptosporangium becharense]MBB5818777.1 N,N'-diacetylchitobiose transport system substrate-binding protein [Streptosporangium becharense]
MKFARIATTTAVTAALALGLAACGGAETAPAQNAGTSAPASGPKFAGQTLTVWRLGAPDSKQTAFMNDLNAKFKELTGADVKLQWVPWPDAQAKWTAALAGGDGPDVTEFGNDQVAAWVAQDALTDITDIVKSHPDFQQIPQNLWSYETVDGKIYATPWGGGTRAVLYRKDWFDELKIETPKNWEDLVAAGKKIVEKKGKDVDGFAFNGGADANMSLSPFVWSAGGDFAAFEGGKWVGKLTQPGFKEGFQYYTDLVAKHGISRKSALTQNSTDIATRFANGKVGMYVTGAWDLTTIKEQSGGKIADKDMAFFSVPSKDGSGPAPAFQGGNDIAIWKDAKNVELAAEYLKLAAGKEFGTRYAKEGGLLPLYPEALSEYATDPVQAPFAETFKIAKGFPNDTNWAEANDTKAVLQSAARAVIEGKKDVDTALADANKELEEILNQ